MKNLIKSEVFGKIAHKKVGQMMGQMLLRQAKKPCKSRLLLLKLDAPCMKQRDDIKNQQGYFVGKMSRKRFIFCGEEYSSILKWGKCGAGT